MLLLNSSGIQWTSLTFSDSVAEIIQDDSWKVCSSNGDSVSVIEVLCAEIARSDRSWSTRDK